MKSENIKIIAIDLFAGGGGVTSGLSEAELNGELGIKTIIAINHDSKAIASHKANHPDTVHFIEDIRTISMNKLTAEVTKARLLYPEAQLLLWASLECTNFSKAKGGQPREADSRTLAWDLYRYIIALIPDVVYIENVTEFMSWGPLDENGKPVSKRAGVDYIKWTEKVRSFGYNYDYRILNCADYGAYTSRIRFFAQFARYDNFIAWPEPTHAKKARNDVFNDFKKWLPVREVLTLSNEGTSIFGRKKDLSEKTLERIYSGLLKFVGDGIEEDTFISKYYSGHPEHKNISINGPAATIKTIDGQAIIKACFIQKYNSTSKDGSTDHSVVSLDVPSHTISTQVRMNLVQAFVMNYYGNGFNSSIDVPAPTVRTKDGMALISWMDKGYSGKKNFQSLEMPSGSIMTKDHFSIITSHHFIDKQYGSGPANVASINSPAGSILQNPKLALVTAKQFIDRNFSSGGGKSQSIDKPEGSILSVPKMNLITANTFLMETNYYNLSKSIDEPAPPLLASRRHQYLVNPQFNNGASSIDKPCFTLIARMDKRAPWIVTAESGETSIIIFNDDSPFTAKIKTFMALHSIVDIKMRMLLVAELKLITGFPDNYILVGNQSDQKKQIGNAVPTKMAKALGEARLNKINEYLRLQTA